MRRNDMCQAMVVSLELDGAETPPVWSSTKLKSNVENFEVGV